MVERDEISGKKLSCPHKTCDGECSQYYGNLKPEIGIKEKRVADLMKDASWMRAHSKPDKWFDKQTKKLQDENAKKDKENFIKEGTLDEINSNRRNLGIEEI